MSRFEDEKVSNFAGYLVTSHSDEVQPVFCEEESEAEMLAHVIAEEHGCATITPLTLWPMSRHISKIKEDDPKKRRRRKGTGIELLKVGSPQEAAEVLEAIIEKKEYRGVPLGESEIEAAKKALEDIKEKIAKLKVH